MSKKVFIINGSGGVGKTTFEKFLSEYSNVVIYSSINKVKKIAQLCGWNNTKTEKDRKFLSDLKILTSNYNDMAFNDIAQTVKDFHEDTLQGDILCIDIREPNEIDRAKKEFNALTVLITNNKVKHITSNMADANVYNYSYDYIVDNNGTLKDLKRKAKYIINQIKEI